MKRMICFVALTFVSLFVVAQSAKVASVNVKDVNMKQINTSDFQNDGKPYVICFWATWCHPCLEELNTISQEYDSWQQATGIKIYAVSIDDTRTKGKVKTLVNGSDWPYEVVIDENSDFKRAMGVNNPPHTFIIDAQGNILWQHAGYQEGDELTLIEKYKEFLNK